jgi:hypothetical protein
MSELESSTATIELEVPKIIRIEAHEIQPGDKFISPNGAVWTVTGKETQILGMGETGEGTVWVMVKTMRPHIFGGLVKDYYFSPHDKLAILEWDDGDA